MFIFRQIDLLTTIEVFNGIQRKRLLQRNLERADSLINVLITYTKRPKNSVNEVVRNSLTYRSLMIRTVNKF